MNARSAPMDVGRKLFVRSEGEGPAVLLLHGFTGSSEGLGGIADALEGHQRIRVDLIGHGESE